MDVARFMVDTIDGGITAFLREQPHLVIDISQVTDAFRTSVAHWSEGRP